MRRLFLWIAAPVLVLCLVAFAVVVIGGRQALIYAALFGIAAGLATAHFIAETLSRRLRDLASQAEAIAAGGTEAGRLTLSGDEVSGVSRRVLEAARDTRARREESEEKRARLEAVLRNMADGIVVLEPDGRIALANGAATVLLGIPPLGELLGARLALLCRNPDLGTLIDAALGGATPRTGELVLDGSNRRVLLVSAAPLAARKGAILVLHDVTRVRQLESMRADFVANVSHELRTPLTAIRGYAETLLGGTAHDPERTRPFLQVIERNAERLSRLIDDLLTLSDLELGRTELRREAIELRGVIDGVLEILAAKADGQGIELRAEVPAELPEVTADRDRIEQVLINLVDNAIKYTPSGGSVRISARPVPGEGAGEVEIAVSDTGIGIPEKDIPRLTERFYRVDRARSRELGGTGLGLAIVKHIVQAHGGSLSIESRVQQGTTVRVELPRAARAA